MRTGLGGWEWGCADGDGDEESDHVQRSEGHPGV